MANKNNIIELKVDGMSCANCAASLNKFLERKGLVDVYVNFQTSEVRFYEGEKPVDLDKIKAGIHKLGYTVIEEGNAKKYWTLERKLLLAALFTFPLLLHHFLMMFGVHWPLMENYWLQFAICLPVFVLGFIHFGRSGLSSIKGGIPNMDVLIFIGSTAAFIYSFIGTITGNGDLIFYETAATIITLVLTGNWLEKRAVGQTTTAIDELSKLQVEKANKIMPSGTIVSLKIEEIQKGDMLQVNEGDKIPVDGRVISGSAMADESMISGESIPIEKQAGSEVIGASLLLDGNIQMEATAVGRETILSKMIDLVKSAQQDKPDIQRLADKISAIFVPVVLGIAVLTFLVGSFGFGLSFQKALMNSIAVLVISCPCAMGLATPTAVMVGVGRLARNGILIKGGQTIEIFSKIKNIVFDKTGTLTTGEFKVDKISYFTKNEARTNALIYKLEQHSSHPIAASLTRELEAQQNGYKLPEIIVEEQNGIGLQATDKAGNTFKIGSSKILKNPTKTTDLSTVFLTENDQLLASIEISDQLKPDAKGTIQYLKDNNFHPLILSGDKIEKTAEIAAEIGIEEYYAEKRPEEKLDIIETLAKTTPTAMVGDGINDAPALAKATLGISLSNASQVAIQSAQIILLDGKLEKLKKAIAISKHTVLTIKQSLFWAFAYNIVAIPMAAMGFLNPMWGALFMAFSDIVVIGNAIRLKTKRID